MFDTIVLGRSLTGALAAIRLGQQRQHVCLLPYLCDTGALDSMLYVPPNIVQSSSTSGEELGRLVSRQCAAHQVVDSLEVGERVTVAKDAFDVELFSDGKISARRVVFAPAGSEGAAAEIGASELFGVGVSQEAVADASFYASQAVAVRGHGVRAAEQALLALERGVDRITVICEGRAPNFGANAQSIAQSTRIAVWSDGSVRELRKDESGHLSGLVVERSGIDLVLSVRCLFLASGLTCDWSAVSHLSKPTNGLVLAGLANDIPYDDYCGMIADSERAAVALSK